MLSDTKEKHEPKRIIITDTVEGETCTNKVVVEILDPVDVHTMVTGSQEVDAQTEQEVELQQEQITMGE